MGNAAAGATGFFRQTCAGFGLRLWLALPLRRTTGRGGGGWRGFVGKHAGRFAGQMPIPQVRFLHMPMEEIYFPAASFDIVLSSLALHYVASFSDLVNRIYHCLADCGWFVFSTEHPIFTAQGPQDWCYDEAGHIRHFPVDRYFDEGPRQAVFLGETVTKYHRTLTTLLQTLLANGFTLRQVVEPQPPAHLMDQDGMKDELRRPMMLIVAAQKA